MPLISWVRPHGSETLTNWIVISKMKTEIIYMSMAPFRGLTKTRNMYYTLCSLTLETHKLTESETFKASFSD
jgi:hypothetical protein